MNESFTKSKIVELIHEFGEVDLVIKNFRERGIDVFYLSNGGVIRLPAGNKRISFEEVISIMETKLEMHPHDFDYWLGESSTN